MRKLIGVIVVLFIILVMMSVFGYIKEFGILDNMGTNIYASYGTVGSFFFYTIYIGIFFGVTSWAVKTSWRKITNNINSSTTDIQANHTFSRDTNKGDSDEVYKKAMLAIELEKKKEKDNKKKEEEYRKALAEEEKIVFNQTSSKEIKDRPGLIPFIILIIILMSTIITNISFKN